MSQLEVNDQVLVMNSQTGQFQFSPMIMWLDRDETGEELYVELLTKSKQRIRLTSSHLIYVADEPPVSFQLVQQDSTNYYPIDLSSSSQQNGSRKRQPPAGSDDNNSQANYYFYSHDNDQANTSAHHVPMQITTTLATATTRLSQTPQLNTKPVSVDDFTYTTYARNVIVGQYLLIKKNSPLALGQSVDSDTDADLEVGLPEPKVDLSEPADDSRSQGRLVFAGGNEAQIDRTGYELGRSISTSSDNVQAHSEEGGQAADDRIKFDQIVSVNYVNRKGIYAPLTREGNIVVNSVVASCYAVVSDHHLAHLSFAPVRWFSYLREWLTNLRARIDSPSWHLSAYQTARQNLPTLSDLPSKPSKVGYHQSSATSKTSSREIHWYPAMLYTLARFVLPNGFFY